MKKNILLCLSIVITLGFAGCGDNSDTAELEAKVKQLEEENAQLREQVNTVGDSTNKNINTNQQSNSGFKKLNLGSKETLDFLEMTCDSASWTDEIKPTDVSSVYSYKPDNDGESYFWLSGTMKNISGSAYSVENIVAELVFDDKYTYTASLIADDGGNDFYGYYVDPLSSVKYYIYSSIPDEMKDTYSKCEIRFGFAENFSGSYYDEFEECDYLYSVTVSK